MVKRTVQERFWAKVDKTGDCWLWLGSTGATGGYGTFNLGNNKFISAHRFAYEAEHGPVPPGQYLDHRVTCPKHCCNPAHLRLVSNKQNVENHTGARRNSRSGVRGVFWSKHRQRWVAQVTHHGKVVYSKRFLTLAEAEAAIVAARNCFHTHNELDRQ